MTPASRYDCHVETCQRVQPGHLRQFLREARHEGAVLVQAGHDSASRRRLVEGLDSIPVSRGVARVGGHEPDDEITVMNQAGVRGARMDVMDTGPVWDRYEPIEELHERLPPHWHLELGLSCMAAARLAPLLARINRVFCLGLRAGRTPPGPSEESAIQWWLEMGNAYVKLLPVRAEQPSADWWGRVARQMPERFVIGSGWPASGDLRGLAGAVDAVTEYADRNAERLYQFELLPY